MKIVRLVMLSLAGLALSGCASRDRTGDTHWVDPSSGMSFIRIEPGRFVMGSPLDEPGREAQELPHEVTISRAFWIGAFEVTQREWRQVMGDSPSWFNTGDDRLPVEHVTWFQAQRFLERLSTRSPGNRFRLPTEAEWEYACRAGGTAAYASGPTLSTRQANIAETPERAARGRTMRVGSFPPNGWGLYDMHGNVWEWTNDNHCPYQGGSTLDPVASCQDPLKVIRGGSWYFGADSARCALRYTHRPQDRGFSLGFRAVREPLER